MCLRFVFLLITRVAAWLRLSRREEAWQTAEILILRHQLAVLQRRQPRRPNVNWADRALYRFKTHRTPLDAWKTRRSRAESYFRAEQERSVDWFAIFDDCVVLIEVKSTRPSEPVRLAGDNVAKVLEGPPTSALYVKVACVLAGALTACGWR